MTGFPTTTVAVAISVALKPLAHPVATTMLVWVFVSVVEHLYIQVSFKSSLESLLMKKKYY